MTTLPNRSCSVDGCNEPYSARGMCTRHYQNWRHAHVMRRKYPPPPDLPGEKWLPIPGYRGKYTVSSLGRVKTHYYNRERLFSPERTRAGYLRVGLWDGERKANVSIHRLVAFAFCGEPDEEVNHKNGVKDDNRASNLEWVSTSENVRHAFKALGKRPLRGESNGAAKATEALVRELRRRYAAGGVTFEQLAEGTGLTSSAVRLIVRRKTWRHLP